MADAPETIPVLAAAFQQDRFAHPDDDSPAASAARLRDCAQRDALPLALVVLDEGAACGTITLRTDSLTSRPELGPWLAAFYVLPAFRGRGYGTQLVRAAEAEARRLGVTRLYVGTHTAGELFRRLGWAEVERLEYCGEPMVICRQELDAAVLRTLRGLTPGIETRVPRDDDRA